MGRPPQGYKCKTCTFVTEGPGPLGQHYKANPSHKLKPPPQTEARALDQLIDNPAHVLRYIDSKVIEQQEVIHAAQKTIDTAQGKIKSLDKWRNVLSEASAPVLESVYQH